MIKKTRSLTPKTLAILRDKGTDAPFVGSFVESHEDGTYLCRQCGLALFRSQSQFNSHCGWPSFDSELKGAVKQQPDSDGQREEIVCGRCAGHLGHVFYGEGFTHNNTRHCVNSTSLDFAASTSVIDSDEGIFAGGCFWGLEHLFRELPGVVHTETGYTNGDLLNPIYEKVVMGKTGHVEAVRVIYDRGILCFSDVAKLFFEIHDPTQSNGQGSDIGSQYLSYAFYYDDEQKNVLMDLVNELQKRSFAVATKIRPVSIFWPAEEHHQRYYEKNQMDPYCHVYKKRF